MNIENLSRPFSDEKTVAFNDITSLSDSFSKLKSELFDPDKRIVSSETAKLDITDYNRIFSGFDNYHFSGKENFENDPALDTLLINFIPGNWHKISDSEKKICIQKISEYVCEKLGMESKPEISFFYEDNLVYGGFNGLLNKLSINEKYLNDPIELIDTIAHELRHAYQFERALSPETKFDEMYAFNFENYIRPEDDFTGYCSQLIESEACSFADQFKNELSKIIGGEN